MLCYLPTGFVSATISISVTFGGMDLNQYITTSSATKTAAHTIGTAMLTAGGQQAALPLSTPAQSSVVYNVEMLSEII